MSNRLKTYVVLILSLTFFYACQAKKEVDPTTVILESIEQIPEYKLVEKRVDSLKKQGIKASVSFSVVRQDFTSENPQSDVITIFINENLGFTENTRYTVRYNQKLKKIISTVPN